MRKPIVFLLLLALLYSCGQKPLPHGADTGAEADTSFLHVSGVSTLTPDSIQVSNLSDLCMVWGFVKYYHADVNRGKFNMDAALCRVLPDVIAARDRDALNKLLEKWVDGFGKPDSCPGCRELVANDSTKLLPDFGDIFKTGHFSTSLVNKLDYIRRNRYQDTIHYYAEKAVNNNIEFPHERPYAQTAYPDCGLRLLGLFRYWNMVQYFFPYRHLLGENWSGVLREFIPRVCQTPNGLEYQLTCLQLMERIHDSHAYLLRDIPHALDSLKGFYFPPFRAGFIEGKLLVRECAGSKWGDSPSVVRKGDIIKRIDGKTIEDLVAQYRPYYSTSNEVTLYRDLAYYKGFLLRKRDPAMQLEIERNGTVISVAVDCRKVPIDSFAGYFPDKTPAAYRLLEGTIGYVYPEHLDEADLDSVKEKFSHTKGIIFDLRCYPSVFMIYSWGAWLKSERTPFCFATVPDVNYPGYFEYSNLQRNGDSSKSTSHYTGK
jgi:hypothetical protein